MATLTFKIDVQDGSEDEVAMAFATRHGYHATITDDSGKETPNPESAADAMQRLLLEYVKDGYYAAQLDAAVQVAAAAVAAKADSVITLSADQGVTPVPTPVTPPPIT